MKISSKLVGAGLATLGAMSLCAVSESANAGSITQPGELVGYSWAPLPQGLYFATTGSYGGNRGGTYQSEEGVNVPVVIWSTPWTIFGGRVEAYAAAPSAAAGTRGVAGSYIAAIYNPYANIGLAWDLGHGFALSGFVGGYAPVNNVLNHDFWTFNSRTGLTWAGDGWTLSGHVVLGITGNNLNSGAGLPFPTSTFGQKTSANYVNLDLAAIKSFGKLSLGVVGFGSWDISSIDYTPATYPYGKQMQFAVGGFVGYDFGPVILQTYLTHDVASQNYKDPAGNEVYETRFFMRAIVPLWNPPAPAPVVAKY